MNERRVVDMAFAERFAEQYLRGDPPASPPPSAQSYGGFDPVQFLATHGVEIRETTQEHGRTKHILSRCPFNHDHTGKDAAVFVSDNGAIGFHCFHNSCAEKKWRDVRQLLEPSAYDRQNVRHQASGTTTTTEPPAFTKLIDYHELLAMDLRPRFLVRGVLVEGQPCVVGGFSKSLKTSIALDLAVSLATGTQFLGRFPTEQCRVVVWSGESGAATIKETTRAIVEGRGARVTKGMLQLCFELPRLSKADHLTHFRDVLRDQEIKVAFVDPLYLALLSAEQSGSAGNVYAMGAALQPLAEIVRETGVTLVILHHFKKSAQASEAEPATLEMLSQAGIVEWARQWILLQRRSPYASDGRHELWLRAGGSMGHASLWAIDADEGRLDPETMTGKKWEVEVKPVHDVMAETKRAVEQKRIKAAEDRDAADVARMLDAIKKAPKEGESKNTLRSLAGLNAERSSKALRRLIGDGKVELVTITRHTREYDGYRLVRGVTGMAGIDRNSGHHSGHVDDDRTRTICSPSSHHQPDGSQSAEQAADNTDQLPVEPEAEPTPQETTH